MLLTVKSGIVQEAKVRATLAPILGIFARALYTNQIPVSSAIMLEFVLMTRGLLEQWHMYSSFPVSVSCSDGKSGQDIMAVDECYESSGYFDLSAQQPPLNLSLTEQYREQLRHILTCHTCAWSPFIFNFLAFHLSCRPYCFR